MSDGESPPCPASLPSILTAGFVPTAQTEDDNPCKRRTFWKQRSLPPHLEMHAEKCDWATMDYHAMPAMWKTNSPIPIVQFFWRSWRVTEGGKHLVSFCRYCLAKGIVASILGQGICERQRSLPIACPWSLAWSLLWLICRQKLTVVYRGIPITSLGSWLHASSSSYLRKAYETHLLLGHLKS